MKKYLIFVLLLSVLLLCAFCEGETQSGDFRYKLLRDGTAEITEYRGKAAALTVPLELDGHRVTTIGAYAFTEGL